MRTISRTSVFKETVGEKLEWPHFLKKKKKSKFQHPIHSRNIKKKKKMLLICNHFLMSEVVNFSERINESRIGYCIDI